jgi:hypothetical protein
MWRNVTAAATEHRVSVVQGASRGMIKVNVSPFTELFVEYSSLILAKGDVVQGWDLNLCDSCY